MWLIDTMIVAAQPVCPFDSGGLYLENFAERAMVAAQVWVRWREDASHARHVPSRAFGSTQ